jgi:hypothetical protein
MWRNSRTIATIMLVLGLSACASISTVENAPLDAGENRSFDAPFDAVKVATLNGVRDLKLEPSSTTDAPQGFIIYIARTPHGISWGEVGRIVVENKPQPPTTVRVHYQRRFALQYTGSESRFARALFQKIDAGLKVKTAN